ncbi:hypothetical protein HQ48_06245 [Porphyromonas sp. COT-290 OH3588]|nr:hypothetical protein HQ48_06245 [Porphyromonas sp. COT-290 OH3588]
MPPRRLQSERSLIGALYPQPHENSLPKQGKHKHLINKYIKRNFKDLYPTEAQCREFLSINLFQLVDTSQRISPPILQNLPINFSEMSQQRTRIEKYFVPIRVQSIYTL